MTLSPTGLWKSNGATPHQSRGELDNCEVFLQKHPAIAVRPMLITSRTITDTQVHYKGMDFEFRPASLYAYTVGANLLEELARPS